MIFAVWIWFTLIFRIGIVAAFIIKNDLSEIIVVHKITVIFYTELKTVINILYSTGTTVFSLYIKVDQGRII